MLPPTLSSLPELFVLVINSQGLHLVTLERVALVTFNFSDIYRWGGSSSLFSIVVWDAGIRDTRDVSVYTAQVCERDVSHSDPCLVTV